MSYSVPFLKINVEGHFGSSASNIVERWQAGFHVGGTGGIAATPAQIVTFLTAIAPATQTFHASTSNFNGTLTFLDAISGALIGVDGRYALGSLQATSRYTYPTPVAGVGTSTKSYADSMVISLRSLLLRGPASHGRIYWPACSATVQPTTGTVNATPVDAFVTIAKTWLDTVNGLATAQFGTNSNVVLVSNKGTGFQSPVVRVGVGQKMDHMESRERDIPELHNFKNLVVSTALLEQLDDEFRDKLDELFP